MHNRRRLVALLAALSLALVASRALGAATPTRTASYIFDDDDRVHVDGSAAPWSAMALVRLNYGAFVGYCSGAFVTPRLMLTAGHCLYEKGYGLVQSVDVFPGRDGGTLRGETDGVTAVWVPDDWRRAADAGLVNTTVAVDYGVVLLPATAAPPASTLALAAESDATLAGPTLAPFVGGYPALNPDPTLSPFSFTPWAATRPALLLVEPGVIGYDVDATEGESGGPVLAGSRLIGIHHGSVDTCNVGGLTRPCNIARRVDGAFVDQVAAVCRQLGGTGTACALQSSVESPAPAPTPAHRRTLFPALQRRARGW